MSAKALSGQMLLTKPAIKEVFAKLSANTPNPETELEYVNDFTLLVAVVLSAQATDKGVNKATKSLFEKVTTPAQMIDLGEDSLKEHIKTIGLYNSKAKNIVALSKMLVAKYDSKVPGDRPSLEELPGVGRKTANVVLNVAFNQPTIPVDTHIFRVSNRIGLAAGKTPLEVEKQLIKNIPKEYMQDAHHLLILHGRYICKARKPECKICPINKLCLFQEKVYS